MRCPRCLVGIAGRLHDYCRAPYRVGRRPASVRPCNGSRRCCPIALRRYAQISRPSPGRPASYPVRCRFFQQEVFRAPSAILPQAMDISAPPLTSGIEIAPLVEMLVTVAQACWTLHHAEGCAGYAAAAIPRAACHQAPTVDALGRVVGIIEIREAKKQMAEFMRANPDPRVLRDCQVCKDLLAVCGISRGSVHLMGPDVIRISLSARHPGRHAQQ